MKMAALAHGKQVNEVRAQISTPQRIQAEANKRTAKDKLYRWKNARVLVGRCCNCCSAGICKRCSCAKEGKACVNCNPSELERCANIFVASDLGPRQLSPLSFQVRSEGEAQQQIDGEVNDRMVRAFRASLYGLEGGLGGGLWEGNGMIDGNWWPLDAVDCTFYRRESWERIF